MNIYILNKDINNCTYNFFLFFFLNFIITIIPYDFFSSIYFLSCLLYKISIHAANENCFYVCTKSNRGQNDSKKREIEREREKG